MEPRQQRPASGTVGDYATMCFGIGVRRENLPHPASSQTRNVGAYLLHPVARTRIDRSPARAWSSAV